ncbi:MAG: NADH-ubiquinone oxidoreductase-F iron-sulfur binding region domain-containing protein, partial [Candidatus Eremiobacterota bacterium]
ILHAFHDRDGYLSDDVLREVSRALKTPLADLFGTVTFYHHFARQPPGKSAARVCTGPICCLHGAREVTARLGASEMPCSGRCDQPVPLLVGDRVTDADLRPLPSPLPVPNPGGCEECVFAHIREPGRSTLKGYGGYQGLERALRMTPAQVVERIAESGLAGRGGAGFPTGTKWRLVAQAEGHPKTVVCNADEGEPGCFKDRALLDHDPHAVLEGMLVAAYATGSTRAFLYLRYEYPETLATLERALQEAEEAGLTGESTGFSCRIYLRRGAGAYICGEEGALLNSLEGRHPFPRNRPPFPVTHGFENLPTAVNNVETLASVPPILRQGAEWYRGLGRNGQAGTKLISLSGDVRRPGNYEVPLGFPLRTLLEDWAGGAPEGRAIRAVTMAGLSGGFLAGGALDVTLDEPSIRKYGSFLGAGGVMVFHDGRDMVDVARQAMEFFAHESCGKCFPCRIGTQRLTERLAGSAGPGELAAWVEEVEDLGRTMKALSACGLGMAAPLVTESLNRYFREDVAAHVGRSR